MRTWAKASTPAALLAVAVMSFGGSGTALADTSGDASIGGGNQVDLPISLPIDISGNSVAAIGSSEASSQGGAEVVNNRGGGGNSNRTSGNASILGGNQVEAPISAPVNACGNAVSLIGRSDAGCKGGAEVRNQGRRGTGGNRTSGDASILGGNQVEAPISAPINACGNAVAIFGGATAGCKGGATVKNSGKGGPGGNRTSGRASVLGGNQVVAPISAPINICGNSVAVVGRAFSGCKGGSSVTNGGPKKGYHHGGRVGSRGNDTDGRFGVGSGNQVVAPISLPINVCGNAVGNATAGCAGGATVHNSGKGAGGNRTSGRASVLGGNQVVAPITAPINVCGNAVALVGRAFAGCKGGAHVKDPGRGAGGNRTSGRASVLGGNQVVAPITAPVNVCGNAVAVLGDAAAGCLGGARVGKPGHGGHSGYEHFGRTRTAAAKSGVLPAVPAVPALGGTPDFGGVGDVAKLQGAGLTQVPIVEDASRTLGLPSLPGLPGLPTQAKTPAKPGQAKTPAKPRRTAVTPAKPKRTVATPKRTAASAAPADRAGRAQHSGAASPLAPATSLVASTPVGGAVTSATRGLPVGKLGLMSAEQPAGVTGMNSSSLLALMLGGLFAASATLFATARRFRPSRKH
ncbi:chaplin family protein [Nonomuraea mesophila]|uniref:chaplin family protein n=1 Tax=Nonomuraea mesophila TaxID=2530382 RepID=UPI0015F2CD9E|nr:chaplin family protein [Nonomuraea mesophila]